MRDQSAVGRWGAGFVCMHVGSSRKRWRNCTPGRCAEAARTTVVATARYHAAMNTRARLDATRAQKFRALVRHANDRSPYYANVIRDRSIDIASCVPEDFPVLTKSMLMSNFNDIVTDHRVNRQVVIEFLEQSSDPRD